MARLACNPTSSPFTWLKVGRTLPLVHLWITGHGAEVRRKQHSAERRDKAVSALPVTILHAQYRTVQLAVVQLALLTARHEREGWVLRTDLEQR